ncbi:MAG: stage II sporulation protein M [Armatimonadetes bacterium]|nr:stage II sporulation protein M [Armatimonadota bacterium]
MLPADSTQDRDRADQRRLAALLEQADHRGLSSLEDSQLRELGLLYRRLAAQLSEARATEADPERVQYLNQLCARAYARIYTGRSRRQLGIGRLFAAEIPRTFRRRGAYLLASGAITVGAALIACIAVLADPSWAPAFVSEGAVHTWQQFAEKGEPAGSYFADTAAQLGGAEFSGLLFSNNIQVALKAFAFGMLFGLGTLYVLIANGFMVGALLGVAANEDQLLLFVSVIAPHGVAELSAILIAGAAGLLIGHALVDPGDRPRRDALRIAAQDAVRLIIGTVPMFLVAGIIEGMISPQNAGLFASDSPRIAFGLLVGTCFWIYLLFGDRLWGKEPAGKADGRTVTEAA